MIPFTQFLRPHGRQVSVHIERPADVERKAQAVINAGFTFETEHLSTGMVSMEVVHAVTESVIAAEFCENDKSVPEAVDRMVQNAFTEVSKLQHLPPA